MADLSLVTDNYFTIASETFSDNLSGSIAAGATTVPVNNNSEYVNGDAVVLTVDPGTVNEATFIGEKSGLNFINCVWTEGNLAVGHSSGATIIDYDSATHHSAQSKGILQHANPDGSLIPAAVQEALGLGAGELNGWNVFPYAVSSVTENGNRSADITFATTAAAILSPSMRLRTSRTVAAPTYMGGAFNGTNHYFTKVTCTSTLSTVTDNFTIMGFAEPTSYALGWLCARYDSSANNGFGIYMEADGRILVAVTNGGSANFRTVSTVQSIPLNKKTHIAASWAGGTVLIYIDGVSVPVGTAVTGGTAPTTAGTGGDFSIGRKGGNNTGYFSGYLSGFSVFNAVLSASTIRSYKNQVLSGSETNCIGAWSLNNTGVNQQASGTNDLTATNSVGYTVRSPYTTDANGVNAGTYDWAIVTKVSGTVVTVQYPEGCAIPTSGGISSVDYSGVKAPFGMPIDQDRYRVIARYNANIAGSIGAINQWFGASVSMTVPLGKWNIGFQGDVTLNSSVSGARNGAVILETSANLVNASYKNDRINSIYTASATYAEENIMMSHPADITAAVVYSISVGIYEASGSETFAIRGDRAPSFIYADFLYL